MDDAERVVRSASTDEAARFLAARLDLPVISAYLFGSGASGRIHRESDVDLAVLLDWSSCGDAAQRFDLRVRLLAELIAVMQRNDVDLVVLNDAPPLLGRRIVTTGRQIYCRDREADRAYVRDVQLRAADVEPFIQRYRAMLLSRLTR
jgi:predicted nucleotidyltransferase